MDERGGIAGGQLIDCKGGGTAVVRICYRFLRVLRLADLRLLRSIHCVSLM